MTSLALGIVTDEICPDFCEAVRHAKSWGVDRFELRVLRSGRVPRIEPREAEEVQCCIQEQHVSITALSPGIFKRPVTCAEETHHELTVLLPEAIAMAHRYGAGLVIVFGFQRGATNPAAEHSHAVEILRKAADLAEREGIRLAIENEPGFLCDTGRNTAAMIRDVGSKALGANWDPCNSYGTPETPFPDGYAAIKKYIFNVHVKDTAEGSLVQCVPVGEGAIDWTGQLKALAADKVVSHVTIETHCLPLLENSRQNVETLRSMLGVIPCR